MYIKNRRMGKIRISTSMINLYPEILKLVFSEFITIKAENDFLSEIITYYGVCDRFDLIPESVVLPEYRVEVTTIFDAETMTNNYKIEFIKAEPSEFPDGNLIHIFTAREAKTDERT